MASSPSFYYIYSIFSIFFSFGEERGLLFMMDVLTASYILDVVLARLLLLE